MTAGAAGARRLDGRAALEAVLDPLLDLADFMEGARSGRLPSREDPVLRGRLLGLTADPARFDAAVVERDGRVVAGHVAERTGQGLALRLLAVGPRRWAGLGLDEYLASLGPAQLPPPAAAEEPVPAPGLRKALSELRWSVQRWAWDERTLLLYRIPATEARRLSAEPMPVNALGDLLAYVPGSRDGFTRRQFLGICLERLEDGRDVYTVADGSRLLHSGWLVTAPGRLPLDPYVPFELPPGYAYLSDVFTDPSARGRGLHARSLACRLSAGARHPGIEWIMSAVAPGNAASRRNVERLGLRHYETVSLRLRLGRARSLRSAAP